MSNLSQNSENEIREAKTATRLETFKASMIRSGVFSVTTACSLTCHTVRSIPLAYSCASERTACSAGFG